MSPSRRAIRAILCGVAFASAGAVLAWLLLGRPMTGIDDADITLVYGRNLALGHGFVYTPGYERVEGSTSMLWTLVAAAVSVFTERPEPALFVISLALAATTLSCVVRLGENALENRIERVVALGFLASIPAFYAWNVVTLMDLSLWTAIVCATALWIARPRSVASLQAPDWGLALAVAAMVLSRPEAMLLAPFAIAVSIFGAAARGESLPRALRSHLPALAMLALTLGGLTVFRLVYFGYPLPNTYYAKVPPDRLYALVHGLKYLAHFELATLLSIPGSLAAAIVFWRVGKGCVDAAFTASRRPTDAAWATFVASAFVLAGLALPIPAGGDHFGSFRFFQPIVPLMSIPLASLLGPRLHSNRRATLAVVAIAAVLAVGHWTVFARRNEMTGEFGIANGGRRIGTLFNEVVPPASRPTIGTGIAGGIAYRYEGRVFDLLGLNWVRMAHASGKREGMFGHSGFNAEVFWSARPDVVSPQIFEERPASVCSIVFDLENRSFDGLFDEPRFVEEYQPGYVPTRDGFVSGFFRKGWLASGPIPGFVPLETGPDEQRGPNCHR